MDAYATVAEFATYLGSSPPDAATTSVTERLLTRASELIDDAVVASFSIDDVTGIPTDSDVAAALRDAVCAQVEFWFETGEENDIDGLAGTQVTVAGYTGTRPGVVAPRALRFLRAADLMRSP